jgi:hypothetical protein
MTPRISHRSNGTGTVSETVSESGCGAVKNCGELKQIVLENPIESAIIE